MRPRITSRSSRRACIVAVALLATGAAQGLARAQMTAKEFNALPDADRRTVLVGALQERERAIRNIRAPSETRVYNVAYRDGKVGSFLADVGRYVCELRRKDGVHRATVDWYLPAEKEPTIKVVTSMDPASGESRSVAQHSQLKGVWGAITTEEDSLIKSGQFHYWFDGRFDEIQEFPLGVLLKHKDAIKFEGIGPDGNTVQISLRIDKKNGTPFYDKRTCWLDPQKGFLPVRMQRHWEYASQRPLYQDTDMVVSKLEQSGGVWFPTHFTETNTGRFTVSEGYASVYETTVGAIQMGGMKDADVKVVFDENVQVQDRLKGTWFVADKRTQSAPPPAEPAARASRSWIVVVNVVAVLAVVAVAALRSRRWKWEGAVTP